MSKALAAVLLAAWIPLSVAAAGVALAAPPGLVRKCADVEYRQEHLSECNLQDDPFLIGGGTGGDCGGLCGVVRGIVGSIPGLGGFLS